MRVFSRRPPSQLVTVVPECSDRVPTPLPLTPEREKQKKKTHSSLHHIKRIVLSFLSSPHSLLPSLSSPKNEELSHQIARELQFVYQNLFSTHIHTHTHMHTQHVSVCVCVCSLPRVSFCWMGKIKEMGIAPSVWGGGGRFWFWNTFENITNGKEALYIPLWTSLMHNHAISVTNQSSQGETSALFVRRNEVLRKVSFMRPVFIRWILCVCVCMCASSDRFISKTKTNTNTQT